MYDVYRQVWNALTAAGAPFEIQEIEVRGNPMKVYTAAPPTLRELWLSSLAHGDNDYLVFDDERWTYTEAHRDVAALASWLRNNGAAKGDKVAIAMRNYPEWMMGYWATVATDLTVVGMNAWWVEDEVEYALNDSEPAFLICDQERLDRFHHLRDKFPDIKVIGVRLTNDYGYATPIKDIFAGGGELPETAVDPDDDACIFYTSGTTGHPKGAQQTHRGCVANVMNLAFAGALGGHVTALLAGETPPEPGSAPPPSGLITTPLFHVTANNCLAHGTTLSGGKLVHMFKWDAGEALRTIEREKITNMTGVPVMSRELISHPDYDKYDTSTLLSVGGGGAQLQPDLVAKIDDKVKTARPGTGYGMTETCGIITSISGDFFVDKPESCGPAMPTFDVKTVDADGNETAQGTPGELWVRGSPVIKGYLNREEAPAETITDGWLHTGDVAYLDEDGFIFIVDRVKDMVLRGGENIYCSEVETVLYQMEQIAECSVFGVPDDRLGEEVGVAIYAKDGMSLTADEIREYCGVHMAKHKIPRFIWLTDEALPRNANGKFLKRELKDQLDVADAV